MGRGSIPKCQALRSPAFPSASIEAVGLCGISNPFGLLSPAQGQVTHALLTRLPLDIQSSIPSALRLQGLPFKCLARLACLNHAASVRSEPGSNSPKIRRSLVSSYHFKPYVHSNIEIDDRVLRFRLSKSQRFGARINPGTDKKGRRRRRPLSGKSSSLRLF